VIVIDKGTKVLDSSVEEARAAACTLSGPAEAVAAVTEGRRVLRTQSLGGLRSVTVQGRADAGLRSLAAERGLELGTVSLQELVSAYGLLESAEHAQGAPHAPSGPQAQPGRHAPSDPSDPSAQNKEAFR